MKIGGCTVVVGGQYGSEAKGKVVANILGEHLRPVSVRCGGPNSGHIAEVNGEDFVFRQLPVGAIHPSALCVVAPGSAVDWEILREEVQATGIPRSRLVVDPRAVVVTKGDRDRERNLTETNGSTGSGTGVALARRLLRDDTTDCTVRGHRGLFSEVARIEEVPPILHQFMDRGHRVVIEGSQGFGLSLLHGDQYPFCTSIDTSVMGFMSQAGVPPNYVDRRVVVLRTFPIRVGGNSGPLANEVDWDYVARIGGAPEATLEYTSCTNRLRRVGLFDWRAAERAVRYNGATELALIGVDRLNDVDRGLLDEASLSDETRGFLAEVETRLGVPVSWVGTGPGMRDMVRRRSVPPPPGSPITFHFA